MTPRVKKRTLYAIGDRRSLPMRAHAHITRVWVRRPVPTLFISTEGEENMAMVGFEKLADLDRRIKEGEAR